MLSIERFEGGFAICEDANQQQHTIPISLLPQGAAEGDIIKRDGNGSYQLDTLERDRRRKNAAERLARLGAQSRRNAITALLEQSAQPLSASALAEKFKVSRQIIVGDIALLRASGAPVVATPRGYFLERRKDISGASVYTIACRHETNAQLLKELYTVVDHGATVLDVIVEHPIYGQIAGQLQVSSRFDADRFVHALSASDAAPLAQLTGGIHLHTIRCPNPECFERIKQALKASGILVSE